jgi:hypothetical protein
MTFKALSAAGLLLFLAIPTGSSYADAPKPSPAPTEGAQQQCPVRVFDVISLAPNKNGPSSAYVLSFETAGPSAGRLGGIVSLFSGNDRYDVHVPDVVAAGSAASTLGSATPAVVHLPSAVTVDAAYLSALDGPNGGPCDAAFVWLKQPPSARQSALTTVLQKFEENLRGQAAGVKPIDATPAVAQAAPSCTKPNEPPKVVRRAQIVMVGGDQMAAGVLITEAALSDTGSVVDAWIWGWAGAPGTLSSLGDFALQETKASGYSPGTFRCKNVASIYLGVVSFNAGAPEVPHA